MQSVFIAWKMDRASSVALEHRNILALSEMLASRHRHVVSYNLTISPVKFADVSIITLKNTQTSNRFVSGTFRHGFQLSSDRD